MKMLLVIISVIGILFVVLLIGILKGNHRIRYAKGYDSELEADYQAIINQKKGKERDKR